MQKPSKSKKNNDNNDGIPAAFITHLERAKYEKRMTKGKEMELPEDSETVKSFLHRSDPFKQLHYSVFNGDVSQMLELLPRRHYTLLIADIPYGFRIAGSTYDDVPFKYPQIEKMVKDFAELTLAPLWRIVIFHSMGQSLSVTTALKSRCHATEHMHWCVIGRFYALHDLLFYVHFYTSNT